MNETWEIWEICPNFHNHSVYQSLTLNFHNHRIIKIIRNLWPNLPPPSSRMVQNHQSNGCPKQWPPHLERLKWPECFAPGDNVGFKQKMAVEIWPSSVRETGNIQDRHVIVTVILSAVIHYRHLRETLWAFFADFFGDFLSCRETLEKLFGKTGGIDKKSPYTVHSPPLKRAGAPKAK